MQVTHKKMLNPNIYEHLPAPFLSGIISTIRLILFSALVDTSSEFIISVVKFVCSSIVGTVIDLLFIGLISCDFVS